MEQQVADTPSWKSEVIRLIGGQREYDAAAEIYSFEAAFEDMLTPEQAVADFNEWVSA